MKMRHAIATWACILAVACGGEAPADDAPEAAAPEAVAPVEGTDAIATTFAVRLDSERSRMEEFELTQEEDAVHIVTGPAGIAWDSALRIDRGDFHMEATFRQFGAPVGYREAYGIFVGGRDLEAEDQEYTYLLVRPTGDFLIKRRIGEITETIVDWTPHAAVAGVQAEGDIPENVLAVDVILGEARFMVNGQIVHAMPAPEARPWGISGLRVNHRLDVRVTGHRLHATIDES